MPFFGCGTVPPIGTGPGASNTFSMSVRGFELSGDPSCNLYVTINPTVPLFTELAVELGTPQMVSFTSGPSGEIIDPSFNVGGRWGGNVNQGSIAVELGQGTRSRPLITGPLTVTILNLPTDFGEKMTIRVSGKVADGGFLDLTVSGPVNVPAPTPCP
jgi:hypothetical protein